MSAVCCTAVASARGSTEKASVLVLAHAEQLEAIRPAVMKVSRVWARTEPEAAELCQEALLFAWSRRHAWHDIDNVQAWVCGVVRNLGRNARRKSREVWLDPELGPPACDRALADRVGIRAREVVAVRHALAQLPLDERRVIELRYIERLSAKEIDQQLGLRGSGSRAVLQRGRRRLRRSLAAHAPGGARLAS